MNDLVRLIEEYKIFNYVVPGVLTVFLIGDGSVFAELQDINIFISFFMYYFVGFLVSRVGSLLIDPLLRKVKFIYFSPYKEYLDAAKKDEKINLLSQENNTYRTYVAASLILLTTNTLYAFADHSTYNFRESAEFLLAVVLILILMVYSFRKQTSFIVSRIDYARDKK